MRFTQTFGDAVARTNIVDMHNTSSTTEEGFEEYEGEVDCENFIYEDSAVSQTWDEVSLSGEF